MAQDEIIFAGFGGQGVLFAGQLLAYAAMDEGRHVTWIPSYGPEMRGGTANCTVVVADDPIGSPLVSQPGVAVVFNKPSFDKYEPLVAPGGLLVVNSALVETTSERADISVLPVPATTEAEELSGNARLANMVMLAAMLTARPVVPLDAIRAALEAHLPEHRRDMLPDNYKALERGAELAAGVLARA
jgi:2-oxoglutarate ferredoxin oxidoreductase subunit gamma